jgi:molybdenum cofactor biosynthesis protein B
MSQTINRDFIPLNIAILTISDTRDDSSDFSGAQLVECLKDAGHLLYEKVIVKDNLNEISGQISKWLADEVVEVIISTGGTGVTGRDGTPEAVEPLLEKTIAGFGELFRSLSYEEIGTSSLQSRCLAGVANGTYVFCLPGSTNACMTGWNKIISLQLDYRTRPCNLVELLPRLKEKG